MINNHTPLKITIIQEHISRTKKQLNKLGLLYDEREKLNPLRWNIKPKWRGNLNSNFSKLKEQVKGI